MKRNIPSYFLLAFLGIWLSVSGVAISQTITIPPVGAVSAENAKELKSLIKTLEDDTERRKLIGQLEVLLAANSKTPSEKVVAPGIGVLSLIHI